MLDVASAAHPEDALPESFVDAWLDSAEAVLYLTSVGVPRTRGTLAKWRSTGGGPPFSYAEARPRYWRRSLHIWAMSELSRRRASPSRHSSSLRFDPP